MLLSRIDQLKVVQNNVCYQYGTYLYTAGEDYTSLTSQVSIPAGSKSSSFSINITDDLIQEDNETFNIKIKLLSNCLSVLVGISSSTVMIIDNDGNNNDHSLLTMFATDTILYSGCDTI